MASSQEVVSLQAVAEVESFLENVLGVQGVGESSQPRLAKEAASFLEVGELVGFGWLVASVGVEDPQWGAYQVVVEAACSLVVKEVEGFRLGSCLEGELVVGVEVACFVV